MSDFKEHVIMCLVHLFSWQAKMGNEYRTLFKIKIKYIRSETWPVFSVLYQRLPYLEKTSTAEIANIKGFCHGWKRGEGEKS